MNPTQISEFFRARLANGEDLVLATVVETAGSTYSKAGTYMIIDSDGHFRGMLSGGCLEGDLAERAAAVIETGNVSMAEYDLSADDELFGLGVGCEGKMRILLQPLTSKNNYEPFRTIDTAATNHESAKIALIVDGDSAGASVIRIGDTEHCFGIDAIGMKTDNITLVFENQPTPMLLVLGAGMDAEPVVGLACELGWRCTVQDHRQGYTDARDFPESVTTYCMPADEVPDEIALGDFDMAMVMSHHLTTDTTYLQQLASTEIGYIGLLGPPHRRERILASIEEVAPGLEGRLHGPAGLDLGGRGPGPIALSIIAEMQRYLSDRTTSG